MNIDRYKMIELMRDIYPSIEWEKLAEADRALNWELYFGPFPADYWTECEPLEYYEWKGWEQACKDISDMLDDLPDRVYYSKDVDHILLENPEDDEENWFVDEKGDHYWQGFDYWKLNPRKYVLHEESYKQIY